MEALSIKEITEAVKGILLTGKEDTLITGVSTNSKQADNNSLFVPIIGERVDGHDYISDAFVSGATACLVSKEIPMDVSHAYIKVEDTLKALQDLATYYRSKFLIPLIGITGSVGKTTTKEMVAAALSPKYKVLKTEGNMNSQAGLPQMILKLNKEHEIAVIEMGISEEGEMSRLCNIAKPDTAILTNIGVSHIAQLKTRENIRKEKLNIINCFSPDSTLFLNGDDELLGEVWDYFSYFKEKTHLSDKIQVEKETFDKLSSCPIVSFGTREGLTFRAEDIISTKEKTKFTLRVKSDDGPLEEDEEEIVIPVLGIHNVHNALVALAVAKYYNVPISLAKKGLAGYRPIAMRGVIQKIGGVTIIDDTYNASPDSIKGGLNVLLQVEATRRIAVLADMRELGDISKKTHYDIGVYIAGLKQNGGIIDEVITVGEEARNIALGIKDSTDAILTHSFSSNEEATSYLKENMKKGDGIMIKGSRGMKTDEIVKGISG